jgi:hypothetical protein
MIAVDWMEAEQRAAVEPHVLAALPFAPPWRGVAARGGRGLLGPCRAYSLRSRRREHGARVRGG